LELVRELAARPRKSVSKDDYRCIRCLVFRHFELPFYVPGGPKAIAPKIAADKIAMQCKDRSSLLAHYQKRVRAYAQAVSQLREDRATCSQEEFKRLWNITDLALRACEASHRSLERHMVDHRCDVEENFLETRLA
jgi:hypothetical protein